MKVREEVVAGTSNVAKYFVYDGANVVLDFVDADGHLAGTAVPTLDKRYFQGPGVDQLLAQENVTQGATVANRIWWVLPDHLGSTRDLVTGGGTGAAVGSVVAHFQYDSFGVILDGRESVTRYQYTGREHDSHTELNYHRARWYDPLTGKWMSEDPETFGAGDPNITRFVGNGVLNATDASGLVEVALVKGRTLETKALIKPVRADYDFAKKRRDNRRVSASADISWKIDRNAFLDTSKSSQPCKCSNLAVIQIIDEKTTWSWSAQFHPVINASTNTDGYTIDSAMGGLFYSTASLYGPVRGNPLTTPLVGASDEPSINVQADRWSGRILRQQRSFETWLVCLSGAEGVMMRSFEVDGLRHTSVDKLTVYAGVGWQVDLQHIVNDKYTLSTTVSSESLSNTANLEYALGRATVVTPTRRPHPF